MEKEFKILEKLELELIESSTRKDAQRLGLLLADKFQEFGQSGNTHNKAETISKLSDEEPNKMKLGNFKFTALSHDSVLVTYKSSCNSLNANRSSIWIKSCDGQWQLLHHQGTTYQPC